MNVAILKETEPNERRVAATPGTVKKLKALGLNVLVQKDAGISASISNEYYTQAGAEIISDSNQLFQQADIFLKVQKPTPDECERLSQGKVWISFLQPLQEKELIKKLAENKVTAFSMELMPRIARAQKCDALSSQSNIAGYKAVLLAANKLEKMFPLMMTAAGTLKPAKVLVIGAGVAGLQAIATAYRLGAVVEAYDTRPAVKEQVQSLGGSFIEVELNIETETKGGYAKEISKENQQKINSVLSRHIAQSDIVITTAAIPGKPSPKIISEEMVQLMHPGAVIMDLASEGGGNCILTEPGKEIVYNHVHILGTLNIPSLMAAQASSLYARNVLNFLTELIQDGKLNIKPDDEMIRGALVTEKGEMIHPAVKNISEKS